MQAREIVESISLRSQRNGRRPFVQPSRWHPRPMRRAESVPARRAYAAAFHELDVFWEVRVHACA